MELASLIFMTALLSSYPVLRILNAWWIDRTVSTPLIVLTLVSHTFILGLVLMRNEPTLLLTYLVLLNALCLLSPVLDARRRRHGMARLLDTEIARYEALVRQYPQNAMYLVTLADTYLERERYDDAISAYEHALTLLPSQYARAEQVKLQRARAARDAARGSAMPLPQTAE